MHDNPQLVGYAVLAIGVSLVLGVIYLAFFAGGSAVRQAPMPDGQMAQALVSDLPALPRQQGTGAGAAIPQGSTTRISPPAPVRPQSQLAIRRQSGIDAAQMKGAWQGMIGRFTAVLQLDGVVYQVILASADPNASRIYSSGTYKIMDDIITLTPRSDWPEPVSGAGARVSYDKLTRAPFSLIAGFQQGRMVWQNVPEGEKRVLTTRTSPLFRSENVNYVVWQRVVR
ncbi:MAG: hypothetical protein WC989_08505 [Micavibrio sp.]